MTTHRIATHSALYINTLLFIFLTSFILLLTPNVTQAAMTLAPSSLDFGEVAVNTNNTLTVTITNTGISEPDLSNIATTVSGSSAFTKTDNCSAATLFLGDSCTVQVTFSPLVVGVATAVLDVSALEGGEVLVSNSVSLVGTGIKAELTVSPVTLDFGEVPVNTGSAVQQVTVSNSGNGSLSLGTISISSEFLQTNSCGQTLNPGESCLVDITFNPLTAGNANGTLVIPGFDTDGVTPLSATVSLTGMGTFASLSVSPSTLDFGEVPVNSSSAIQQVTVSNPGSGPLSLDSITISGEFSQTNSCAQTLNPGENCLVDITYNPQAAGIANGTLVISGIDSDGVTPLSATVSLTGLGTSASLSVSPAALDFGLVDLGSISNIQEVTLSNTGNELITLIAVTIAGDFASSDNCSATLNPGESCVFSVTFQPQTLGSSIGSLNISTQDLSQTLLNASVSLSGSTTTEQQSLKDLLLSYAGSNPSVRSTAIVIADTCSSGRASDKLQEDCNTLIQAAESGDAGTSRALLEITPERAIKASRMIQQGGLAQLANSSGRIVEIRNGSSGFSVAGLALSINEQMLSGNQLTSMMQVGDTGGAAGSEGGLGSKWGGFITGTVISGDKDATSLESGLDFRTNGIMAGIDYRFSDQFVLGGAIGYTKIDTDLDNDGGDLDTDGYSLTAYGTYYGEKDYFIDFSATYGSYDFDQERRLSYQLQNLSNVNQVATASYDGDMLSLFVAAGYDFNYGGWTFGPRMSFEYIDAEVDDITEKMSNPNASGAGWATHIEDTDQQWLTLKLGGNISYAYSTSWGVLTPYAGVDWLHEFKDDSQIINGNFVEDPGSMSFNLFTEDPDKNYLQLSLGVSAVLPGGVMGYLNYETILSNDLWDRDTINAGIRVEF